MSCIGSEDSRCRECFSSTLEEDNDCLREFGEDRRHENGKNGEEDARAQCVQDFHGTNREW